MRRQQALIRADWRNISRDLLLMITIFVPLLVAVFVRIVTPIATELLTARADFDLTVHYVFIAGMVVLMTPMMLGAMAGLQILDDRDERILTYISVTPITREGYVVWKLLTPMIIGMIITPIALVITNIIPLRFGILVPVTLLTTLGAPIYALLLASFATNKVEGLAVSKASGVLMVAPFAGYLLESPWRFLAGIMPPFWPIMAMLAGYGHENTFWMYILGGVITHLAWIALLRSRFNTRTG